MASDHKDYPALIKGINAGIGGLQGRMADTMKGFGAMAKAAGADGAVDAKTKELIALAIGVATKCDGCIGFHTKKLADLGATDEEVAETLAMCVYMGGGPSLMYAADAWTAWEQFRG